MRMIKIGSRRFPCGAVMIATSMLGVVMNALLACFLVLYSFDFLPASYGAEPGGTPRAETGPEAAPDLSMLNVRLSNRPIRPPEDQLKRTVLVDGIRVARPLFGPPTRAAILEDDAARRVLILSAGDEGPVIGPFHAYLLYDFDLERRLPMLAACAHTRRCDADRTPGTGGLGCVAMCLVETLRE